MSFYLYRNSHYRNNNLIFVQISTPWQIYWNSPRKLITEWWVYKYKCLSSFSAYCTVLYHTVSYHTVPYHTVPYCSIMCIIDLWKVIIYFVIIFYRISCIDLQHRRKFRQRSSHHDQLEGQLYHFSTGWSHAIRQERYDACILKKKMKSSFSTEVIATHLDISVTGIWVLIQYQYGSGHGTAAVLLSGFAIIW